VSNVVGSNAPGTIQQNVLSYLLLKLAANETLEIQGDGDFYRDYIHVEDCVRATELVMANGDTNTIYNIGNGITYSFIEILEYAAKTLKSGKIVFVPQKDLPLSFSVNTGKLRSLGYVPKYTGEKLFRALLPR